MIRKERLVTGEVYHVLNRSIAGFKIIDNDIDSSRLIETIQIYQHYHPNVSISRLNKFPTQVKSSTFDDIISNQDDKLVNIVAYVLMPTHIHFILKQLIDNGISIFMGNVCNSYAKYFNIRHKRYGHLWQGKFKNIRVNSDDQLLHLTRYIHLNPTSAGLVKKPDDWKYSSYSEFIKTNEMGKRICDFRDLIDITPKYYKQFVNDRIDYQKEISRIKSVILENYTG